MITASDGRLSCQPLSLPPPGGANWVRWRLRPRSRPPHRELEDGRGDGETCGARECEVSRYSPRTACTRMLEGGDGLSVVATILGGSPANAAVMAKRYGHIGDTARRTAVAVLDSTDVELDKRGHKIGRNSPPPKNPIF